MEEKLEEAFPKRRDGGWREEEKEIERYIERERERCRGKKVNKYCLSMCCAVYMDDNCFILIFGLTLKMFILNMNNLQYW